MNRAVPIPIRWRQAVTEHSGVIDDPSYRERGRDRDLRGQPWIDAKTWAVAQALAMFMDNDGECYPSYATLAAMARISRTAAIDGVNRLVSAGLLMRVRRRKGPRDSDSNIYRAMGVVAEGDQGSRPGRQRWSPRATQTLKNSSSRPQQDARCDKCGGPRANRDGLCVSCWPVEWGVWKK